MHNKITIQHDVNISEGDVASTCDAMEDEIDEARSNIQQLKHVIDLDGGLHHD